MKNTFKITLFAIIMAILTIFVVSCGEKENYTSIETPNLEYKDGAYTIAVSSDVKSFDLSSLFTVSENATFEISRSENFDKTIEIEVSLEDGSNKFYVKVKDSNKNEAIYQFVIVKSKLCTVTFNVNGGSEVPQIKCEEGRVLEAPVSLKPGYTLSWDYDFTKAINSDITINAVWTANKYKISIDGTDSVVEVTFGEKPNLVAPEKLGYSFTGWLYNGVTFDATQNYSIEGDITVKASYEIQKYTINYVTIGDANSNPTTYTVEDEIVFKDSVWNTSEDDTLIYEFQGWFKDAEYKEQITKIEKGTTGNIDVYGKWSVTNIPEEKNGTKVTFNAPGFDCDKTVKDFTVGDEYALPVLEQNGYIFNGWKSQDDTIVVPNSGVWALQNEEITLVPNWTKRTYSITYILNGGTESNKNVETFTVTDSITLYDPVKEYSEFAGWYTDPTFETEFEGIKEGTFGDIVLYAKWNVISNTITLDANGGQISQNSLTVILGSDYTIAIPQRTGYKFDGWYDGENLFNPSGKWLEDKDISLVARWTIETYKLEYTLNDGEATGLKDSYTVEDESYTLPIPTQNGKIFLGWSLNGGNATQNMILEKGSIGDRVYVANWCDDTAKNGVKYSISNGVATVIGYTGTVGANITIPSEYNGYTVVAIGNDAFNGYGIELAKISNSSFTTLVIPQTITRIGANAFKDCDDLKVQLANAGEDEINAWVEKVVVESGNDHVVDVIRNKRPAIGWRLYYKPKS